MRPSLIPHSFITKNIRKKYHKKRSSRSWGQYYNEYSSYLWLLTGFLFILFILYIKYVEKQRKRSTEIHSDVSTDVPDTHQNGFLYYS